MNQKIDELVYHLHSNERWFELKSSPTSVNVAVRFGVGATSSMPFVIDAGDNTWGSWVQVLGSSDTPIATGSVKFDFHRVSVSATERSAPYGVQFAWATSGTSAGSAYNEGSYTEFVYSPTGVTGEQGVIDMSNKDMLTSQVVWARCICPGQNTGTLSFFYCLTERYS